jgi:2'-5' RNA ligase
MPIESALVAIIPEAEEIVRSFRDQFDPSASAGVPAHVTITYPFKPPSELTEEVTGKLHRLFAGIPAFNLQFRRAKRFPSVLYLAPEPDEELRRLTKIVAEIFPEAPPYEGIFDDVVPHLTIAHAADARELESIAADFARHAQGRLPIKSTVKEIVLIDNEAGRWQPGHRFPLRPD